MSEFVPVARLEEIPDPGRQLVEIDDRLVVLFHVGGQVWAIDDVCTHDGGPLGDGELTGYEIACPRHGARFDIRDGRVLSMPATRATVSHQTRIEDGQIYVKLHD